MVKRILNRILSLARFCFHSCNFCLRLLAGKIFGISYIITYLRNPNPSISVRLLRAFGAKIGKKTTIKRSIYFDNVYRDRCSAGNFSHLKIGKNCYIGDCIYFDLANEIIIEDNVVISGGVSFVTHADCSRSRYLEKIFPRTCKKIIIQNGVWIAFKATILNGVTIGKNSVVAAHSLVKENVMQYCMYEGIPAKKTKGLKLTKQTP